MHKFRASGAEVPVNPAQEACRARFEKFTKCEHGRVPENRTSTLQLQRCGAMRASRYARFGYRKPRKLQYRVVSALKVPFLRPVRELAQLYLTDVHWIATCTIADSCQVPELGIDPAADYGAMSLGQFRARAEKLDGLGGPGKSLSVRALRGQEEPCGRPSATL